jgi:hypothetical protein
MNSNKINEKFMKKDFEKYADSKTHKIGINGMEKMGTTLEIDIYTDIFITYFFFKCNCQSIEEVSESEFIKGLRNFDSNSLNDVKSKIPKIRKSLHDFNSKNFKDFYYFLFIFNSSKLLSIDIVEVYFKDLFYEDYPISEDFIKFLKETKNKGLNKDQWECFLDFLLNEGSRFPEDYDCDSYYPVLINKFYEWYCDLKKIPRQKNDDEYE